MVRKTEIEKEKRMKVLFLTLKDFSSFDEENIYCDLLREFIENGHDVYCISPTERRYGSDTHFCENKKILKLKIGNIQKTNFIEKGISTFAVDGQFLLAAKRYFNNVRFDAVIYSTPPVTFVKTVSFLKRRDGAKTYLLLKDIFPQNAVDIGILTARGIKGLIYKYFRNKEKKLYSVSDKIGCMSEANKNYILTHNPEIPCDKVGICPNSIVIKNNDMTDRKKHGIRCKFNIPTDKTVFVYGGNLGRPQGIEFVIECMRAKKDDTDVFFIIAGDGTEYSKIEAFVNNENPVNVRLLERLPTAEFDELASACDIGLIFLDHRFTIPNFPSRLLSYMQAGLPVLACTDPNTDIGKVIEEGGFGWWCESDSTDAFCKCVDNAKKDDLTKLSDRSKSYLAEHYSVKEAYKFFGI